MVVVRVLTRPLPAAVLCGGSGFCILEISVGQVWSHLCFFVGWLMVFGIKLVFI